jgi:uncharacterized membrane protein YdjX (TVP38/TMEM64 family)
MAETETLDAVSAGAAQDEEATGKSRAGLYRLIALAVIIAALIVAVRVLPVRQWLNAVLRWTEELGVWGPVFVVGVYLVSCVLFLPGSVITMGTGFLFGVVKGTITVSIGSTLGACLAFLLGRFVARKAVERKVADSPKFGAIDHAVGEQGFKIVLLTRLSPIFPFNLLNYAYGLTRVRFGHYALGSWIGMLPGTVMYVYLGHAMRRVAATVAEATQKGAQKNTTAQQVFFWVGLVIAVGVAVFVTRVARKALREAAPEAAEMAEEADTAQDSSERSADD